MKLTLKQAAHHDHAHQHLLLRLALAAGLLIWAGAAWGQKAAEMLIPIGQSSGLSGQHTLVARVQAVNAAEPSLVLMQGTQDTTPVTIRLDTRTPLWLDRSPQQQGNLAITLADVRPGMLAEVKFRLNDRRSGEAEWVKLQAAP